MMRRATNQDDDKFENDKFEDKLDLLNLRVSLSPGGGSSGDPHHHVTTKKLQTCPSCFYEIPSPREQQFSTKGARPKVYRAYIPQDPSETTETSNSDLKASQELVVAARKFNVTMAKPEKGDYHGKEHDTLMDSLLTQVVGDQQSEVTHHNTNNFLLEYESKATTEILDPELNLNRLGFTQYDMIDWNKVTVTEKKDLYLELCKRITNRKNTDCTIKIGRDEFECHLIVLQCYSDVFDGYASIKKMEIAEEKCSASSFSYIYSWMVGESQEMLTRDNLLDILQASKYLEIQDLVEQCWALIDSVDVFNEDTAYLLYVDAKRKDMDQVCELMIPRIQDFFLLLVSSQDWLELNVDDVKSLLSSNYIRINCEMEVFMSAIRWLKHDWTNRDTVKYDVLNCVRFGDIALWQLIDIKRNFDNPEFVELAKDSAICQLIDDALAFGIAKNSYGQESEIFQRCKKTLRLPEYPPRNWSGEDKTHANYRDFLIYLDQNRRSHSIEQSKPRDLFDKRLLMTSKHYTLEDYKKKEKTVVMSAPVKKAKPKPKPSASQEETRNVLKMFTKSKQMMANRTKDELSFTILAPKQKRYLTATTLFLRNRETILVFGGMNPYESYTANTNNAQGILQYLPDTNAWIHVGDLPEPRHHHSVAFMKGRIYLAGGVDPRNDEIRGKSYVVNTVWSFDPVQRVWCAESPLLQHRRNFGLVVYKQKMYAIGGNNQKVASLATVERFDADKGVWEYVAPMQYPRTGVSCARYRDCIWAAGGCTDLRKNALVHVVECYNIRNDQWINITRLKNPRSFGAMFVMSDTLYLIGGVSHVFGKDKASCSVNNVDIWDSAMIQWKTLTELCIPRHGHCLGYVGGQIMVLGGVTTTFVKCLKTVECFCTKRNTWIKGVSDLPIPLSGHGAITLPPATLLSNH